MEADVIAFEITRLALSPDDVLIVRPKQAYAMQQYQDMQKWFDACEALHRYSGRIVVVPHDFELLVISKDQAPA